MPSGNVWNNQWLSRNAIRAYPLAESSTRLDTSTSFRLPDSLIVDLNLPVHTGLSINPGKFFLKSITVFPAGIGLTLGYDDGTLTPPSVATTAFSRNDHVEDATYTLVGINDFADSQGYITIGRLNDLDDQPAGKFSFSYAGGKLEVGVIRPQIRGVTSLTFVNGDDESDRLTGDVVLTAGTNISYTVVNEEGQDPTIRIDAIEGEGLNESCDCLGADDLPECIRSVNGVTGDAQGTLNLLGSGCITFTPVTNGLRIANTCSAPCAGCGDLERVTEDLSKLNDGASTLTTFVNKLGAEVSQLAFVVLGSKLGDSGTCIECTL